MAAQLPSEPQVPHPNGIPKVNPQRCQFGSPSADIYDTICIGFSTTGLGLAVALSDLTLESTGSMVFVERSPRFSSRLGSESQYMNTSFAEDLATMRCPTSPYTFLNYLFQKQGLESFLSSSTSLNPRRDDFEEYLQWVAAKFQDLVMYEEEVLSVEAVSLKGAGILWAVTMQNTRTGEIREFVSKKVVFAKGGKLQLARTTGNTELLSAVGQMEERRSGKLKEDEVLSDLALASSKMASFLVFGSDWDAKAKRATL